MTARDRRTRRASDGENRTGSDSRLPIPASDLLAVVVVAVTVAIGVLAYPELPERMALHWRVGLDGTASTGTHVSRTIGSFLFAAVAVAVLALKATFDRTGSQREPELEVVVDGLFVAVLVGLAALQTVVVVLNAV